MSWRNSQCSGWLQYKRALHRACPSHPSDRHICFIPIISLLWSIIWFQAFLCLIGVRICLLCNLEVWNSSACCLQYCGTNKGPLVILILCRFQLQFGVLDCWFGFLLSREMDVILDLIEEFFGSAFSEVLLLNWGVTNERWEKRKTAEARGSKPWIALCKYSF